MLLGQVSKNPPTLMSPPANSPSTDPSRYLWAVNPWLPLELSSALYLSLLPTL